MFSHVDIVEGNPNSIPPTNFFPSDNSKDEKKSKPLKSLQALESVKAITKVSRMVCYRTTLEHQYTLNTDTRASSIEKLTSRKVTFKVSTCGNKNQKIVF